MESPKQEYTFNVEMITTGLDDFLETVEKLDVNIITSVSGVSSDMKQRCGRSGKIYTLNGTQYKENSKGILVTYNRKYRVK